MSVTNQHEKTDCGNVLSQQEALAEDSNQPDVSEEDSRTVPAAVQPETQGRGTELDRSDVPVEASAQALTSNNAPQEDQEALPVEAETEATPKDSVATNKGLTNPYQQESSIVQAVLEKNKKSPKFVAVVNPQDHSNRNSEGDSNQTENPGVVVVYIVPKKKKQVAPPDHLEISTKALKEQLDVVDPNVRKTSKLKFLVSVIESQQKERDETIDQLEVKTSKQNVANSDADSDHMQQTNSTNTQQEETQSSPTVFQKQETSESQEASMKPVPDAYLQESTKTEAETDPGEDQVVDDQKETTGKDTGTSSSPNKKEGPVNVPRQDHRHTEGPSLTDNDVALEAAVQSHETSEAESVSTSNQSMESQSPDNPNAGESIGVPHEAESDDSLRIFVTLLMGLLSTKCKSWQNIEQWVAHNNKLVCLIMRRVTLCEGFTPDLKDAKGICKAALRDLERYFCGRHILESVITLQDPAVDEAVVRTLCFHIRRHSEKLFRRASTRDFWRKELQSIFCSLFSFRNI